jgi:hypothetical protein
MKSSCRVLLIGILIMSVPAFSRARTDGIKDLRNEIPRVMKEAHVPGLQVTVIRDGNLAWHQSFGVKSAANRETSTIFATAGDTRTTGSSFLSRATPSLSKGCRRSG